MKNDKWEYMEADYQFMCGEFGDWLNVHGQDGWRCYHIDRGLHAPAWVCFFRRLIVDEK